MYEADNAFFTDSSQGIACWPGCHLVDFKLARFFADIPNLVRLFARLHYKPERGGILDIKKGLLPRQWLSNCRTDSLASLHSGFNDLVLRDLGGIKFQANGSLVVNPHADPGRISHFRADHITYHGHEIAVQWDATGERYGKAGLQVETDGEVVAEATSLRRLTVDVTRQPAQSYASPIEKPIQLNSTTEYPHCNLSIANADIDRIHDVRDGRI